MDRWKRLEDEDEGPDLLFEESSASREAFQ
jgi:hypothetical protein